MKLYESVFELVGNSRKRLLRPTAKPFVAKEQNVSKLLGDDDDDECVENENRDEDDEGDSDGSLSGSESEEEEKPKKQLKKPIIKKKITRRKKASN